MPGVFQLSVDEAVRESAAARAYGVPGVLLFGLPDAKDDAGSGAYDPEGPVQAFTRAIKREHPDVLVVTDVCLCEYTAHGHCGVIVEGEVANDPTVDLLVRTALSHAEAGADVVAPSDMMDGRVGRIRQGLDAAGFSQVAIMSTPRSTARRSTDRSARPRTRPPRSAIGARTRWTRRTSTKRCARWRSTSTRAPTS
jgi:porphobilinogen synthase